MHNTFEKEEILGFMLSAGISPGFALSRYTIFKNSYLAKTPQPGYNNFYYFSRNKGM